MLTVSYLDLIILIGAVQGFLLGLVLVSVKKLRTPSNIYLALLLFILTLVNIENFIAQGDLTIKYPVLKYFTFEILCLIPLCIYFFINKLLNSTYKITRYGRFLVLYCIVDFSQRFVWLSIYLFQGGFSSIQEIYYLLASDIFQLISALITLIVIIYSINELKIFQKSLYNNYTEIEGRDLIWLKNTFIIDIFIVALWIILSVSDFGNETFNSSESHLQLSYIMWVSVSFVVFWVGYSMIIHHTLIRETKDYITEVEKIQKNQETKVLSNKTKEHFQKILKIVEDEKMYRDKNLTLASLSEKTGLSYSYVSQIINKNIDQNFFEFINTYRIEDVKKNMTERKFDHYSIMGLAQISGFNSKSTFNSVFKKQMGMTPSAYRNKVSQTNT